MNAVFGRWRRDDRDGRLDPHLLPTDLGRHKTSTREKLVYAVHIPVSHIAPPRTVACTHSLTHSPTLTRANKPASTSYMCCRGADGPKEHKRTIKTPKANRKNKPTFAAVTRSLTQ
eukprot:GHVU01053963.1.p2 GENE.GHVU01053963.1~~GHVU01053963.1.p2  ORF type:complete len:116 (-),score=0.45 GHVU01053963.1:309-656(-)